MAVSLAHDAQSIPRRSWHQQFAVMDGVQAVTATGLARLSEHFARHQSPDPYAHSPAYTALTARHGLWVQERAEQRVFFGWHPNTAQKIIVFPPSGSQGQQLAAELVGNLELPPGGIEIIRLPEDKALSVAGCFNRTVRGARFSPIAETVLDWAYPVHTLDTQAVSMHRGRGFEEFRQKVNKAERQGLVVEPLDIVRHGAEMLELCGDWSRIDRGGPDDRFSPMAYAVALYRSGEFDLDGFVSRQAGRIVGFQIWENPLAGCAIANGLVGIADISIPGLAEFQEREKARILADKGIALVCVGGSETAGLDRFKRKMQPVQSQPLQTLKVA